MGAKSQWLAVRQMIDEVQTATAQYVQGNVQAAREILAHAFKANPDSEDIWLAAIKLESENNEFEVPCDHRLSFTSHHNTILSARSKAPGDGPQQGRYCTHLDEVCASGVGARQSASGSRAAPTSCGPSSNIAKSLNTVARIQISCSCVFAQLWMMLGQIAEQTGDIEAARDALARGIKNCPTSTTLWIISAKLEQKAGQLHVIDFLYECFMLFRAADLTTKARAILEKARQRNTASDELWSLYRFFCR